MKKYLLSLVLFFFCFNVLATSGLDANIRKTCNEGDAQNMGAVLKDVPSAVLDLPYEEMTEYFAKRKVSGSDIWILMGLHSFNVRKSAYDGQTHNTQAIIRALLKNDKTVEEQLEILKNSTWIYPESSKKYTAKTIDMVFAQGTDEFSESADKYAAYICLRYFSISCKDAIRRAIETMDTRRQHLGGFSYYSSTPKLIKEILTDETYGRVLVNVASIVHKRAMLLTAENQTESTDIRSLDQIFMDEFLKLYFSQNEARTRMLKIFGVYGTRGASIDNLFMFVNKGNYMPFIAMQIIFAGMNFLDFENTLDTTQFSLPASVTTSCLYGSPYHFWMAAFLADDLKSVGLGKRPSFLALHILTVGYQMFIDTITRRPGDLFRVKTDSWQANYIRTTVAMNDAGAMWGLIGKTYSNFKWNLDVRLKLLLTKYKPRKKEYSESEIEQILRDPIKYYLLWTREVPHDSFFSRITSLKNNLNLEANESLKEQDLTALAPGL